MISTLRGPIPRYLGADLTDRYAGKEQPRAIAVCGLDPIPEGFFARFWTWEWDRPGVPLDVGPLEIEITNARLSMLDAPQGLARPGRSMREADRRSGAAGKVPDSLRKLRGPYAGFVRSSLEVFAALHAAGVPVLGPDYRGGAGEVYPGHIWQQLGDLPRKTTSAGREARVILLERLGVVIPATRLPTHDDLDACAAALVASALDGAFPGLEVAGLGEPLYVDGRGVLREGQVLSIALDPRLRARLARAAAGLPPAAGPRKLLPSDERPRIKRQRAYAPRPGELPALGPGEPPRNAEQLLGWLVQRAESGDPVLLSYRTAYELLFGRVPGKWSMAYAKQVIRVALQTEPVSIRGLGQVALDAFVVAQNTRRPGAGHWEGKAYDEAHWGRVFGGAALWGG